jgi:homoserine O-acetyltransferase/O-succinyltransferase
LRRIFSDKRRSAEGIVFSSTFAILWICFAAMVAATPSQAQGQQAANPLMQEAKEGDYIAHDFHFKSGETMAELRLHYTTLGKPEKDANGQTTNAVMILHGTTGSGRPFLGKNFGGVLFGPGELLDASKYFIILPDSIGHGKSSKPSDGMHAHFSHYDYDDMVAAQHEMLVKGLGVNHLRLVGGTSMGCMHSWVWAEMYPDFMDAALPLACLPVQISGRNRLWRKMVIDGIRTDPAWMGGDYTSEPQEALRIWADFLIIATSAPLYDQKSFPTRDAADQYEENVVKRILATADANDVLYAVDSSRNYDPSTNLDKIKAYVMFINFADDFINPPDLGMAEREIRKVRHGKYVLIPESEETHGHGTHSMPVFWQQYLKELLDESAH